MKRIPSRLMSFSALLITIAIACGLAWSLWTGRIAGDLIEQCQIQSNNATVRLYIFNGSSATTSDSYTVTYQKKDRSEKRIFYSYSSPFITDLGCKKDQVILFQYDEEMVLPIGWIEDELVRRPLKFQYGQLKSLEYEEDVSTWESAIP